MLDFSAKVCYNINVRKGRDEKRTEAVAIVTTCGNSPRADEKNQKIFKNLLTDLIKYVII